MESIFLTFVVPFQISKSNVVDDMVASNKILYETNEHPDHCVVIKYVPYVGDSKRAMDEYTSQIMLGGHNTLVIHNTCEDSLLASPLILDLVILGELCTRIQVGFSDLRSGATLTELNVSLQIKRNEPGAEYAPFRSVLSLLSYLCKAPLVPKGTPVVNSLFRQRAAIENILKACVGLPPNSHMALEHRFDVPIEAEPPRKKVKSSTGKSVNSSNTCKTDVTEHYANGVPTNGYTNGVH